MMLALAGTARAADVPGVGRVDAGGQLDGLAVVGTEGGKRQRPELLGTVRFDVLPAARWLRARLEVRGRVGGPFEGGPGIGIYDFERAFQNYSPSFEVREGWVEARSRRAELRLGVQQLAWGRLDGVPPTDVVNPRDYHDPIVWDAEDRKIGIPAAVGTAFLPDGLGVTGARLTLGWLPWGVPSRLAELEERWFPNAALGSRQVVLPAEAGSPDRTVDLLYSTANDPPAHTFDGGGIAARLAGSAGPVDWDLYSYNGPETAPDLRTVTVARNAARLPRVNLVADVALTQTQDTIHMTGADLAVPIGDWTLRAEVAGTLDKPMLRNTADLTSPAALRRIPYGTLLPKIAAGKSVPIQLGALFPDVDVVEWGTGVDTVWNGFQPILQVSQVIPIDAPRLLIADPETRFVGVLRKKVWDERIELEGRAYMAVNKADWFLFPRVGWRIRDDLRVRVGYLALGGPRRSLVGQFGDNDEVVFDARWSF